jgi:hypothetical protein
MAEAPRAIPSFKLVLVGDGGTGKVSRSDYVLCNAATCDPSSTWQQRRP